MVKASGFCKECYRLIELDPEYYFGYPYWRMFYIYARKSENVKAVEALTKAMMRDSLNMKAIDKINEVYAKSGINGLWTWLIEIELEKSNPSPLKLAHRYSKTGKKDEAIYWLEKAYSNPPPEFPRFFNDPDFDILHSESGYKVIIEKMGLSRYH